MALQEYASSASVSACNIPNSSFYVFHIDFRRLHFLLLILANSVCDESCREKLVPISPNGSIILEAAVNPAHRCTL